MDTGFRHKITNKRQGIKKNKLYELPYKILEHCQNLDKYLNY